MFKALKCKKRAVCGALAVFFVAYLTHAQLFDDAYTVRTVHIFPSNVDAVGWLNVETVTFQNLKEYALSQEFNAINSATLNLSTAVQSELDDVVLPSEPALPEEASPDIEVPEIVSPILATTTEETATLGDQEVLNEDVSFDIATSTDVRVVDTNTSISGTKTTTTEAIPEQSTLPAEAERETGSEEEATTTVLRRVSSLFRLALSTVTSAFEQSTTSDDVGTVDVAEAPPEELVLSSATTSTTTNQSSPQEATTTPEEVFEEVVDENAASSTANPEVPAQTAEASSSDETGDSVDGDELTVSRADVEFVPEEVLTAETPTSTCEENCKPYAITLSDFSFPLDPEVEITGAQLRLSFAAKQKETREHVPVFEVHFSLDGGSTWQEGGSIAIDGEVSNSINGGYFLFALPEITDQSLLDQLQVQLSYQDDPAVVAELYVESAWLELFTIEPPETPPTVDFLSLLENDGYNEEPLVGDVLELPNGETLHFDHTDRNDDETLIIKATEETYEGFSEATTYFSVTNTTDNDDTFTVQTYFPGSVGEVTSLEVFEQNKPIDVVIPEYRPYVYHCEDGWEYAGELPVSTLQELSQQLAAPVIWDDQAVPVDIHTISSQTTSSTSDTDTVASTTVDFAVPTSTEDTDDVFQLAPLSSSSNTTTVLNTLPSLQQLLQFSTTAPVVTPEIIDATTTISELRDEAASSSTESATESINVLDGEEVAPAYSCRNTTIIRECDELDGGNTACRVNQVKVAEHKVVRYAPGWEPVKTTEGAMPEPGFLKRVAQFIGFGPDRKEVPEQFEVRTHTPEAYTIRPGETLYFKLDISFPPFSRGEYWIEAVGDSEYGLLDPFWSSQWTYRMPIKVSNPTGSDQTEYQVFLELDSVLSDFWSNVNSDGSDIRFIQELPYGNFSDEGTAVNNWLDFDFGYRVPIEIPAGTVTEDLTNFPVSIDLSTLDSTFWSNVKTDGGDIRVYTTDGTELPIDLADIDTNAQTGALHFLADTIPASGASTFYLYFNDSTLSGYASTSPMGSQAVWTGSSYNAVYHFTDDPTSVSNLIADETGNGRDLTVSGAALATTSGQFGAALDLSAGAGYLGNSAWNFQSGNPLYVTGSYFMTALNGEALWQWGTGNNPDPIRYQPWYNATNGRFTFANTAGDEYPTRSIASTTWHGFGNIGATSTSENNYVYEDGILVETLQQTTPGPANTTGGGFEVGRLGGGGSWSGYLDELRVATTTRSLAWVRAESVNLYQPTQFYTPRQTQSPNNASSLNWYSTSWDQRIRLSIPAASLQEDLTDFPVYVDLATLGTSFFSGVASDGRDIRVTAGDGVTELPLEIVAIDTGAKTGELYFKTDLSNSDTNDFYIYFDNSDVSAYARTDTYGSDNVWTNGFQAVYHLQEDASGTSNPNVYKDSTSNQYDGDDENSSNGKSGLFGAGQEFGDSQTDYLSLPYEVMDGLTDNSVSWWHISSTSGDQTIVSGANSTQFNEFWERLDNDVQLIVYSQGAGETFNLSDTVVNYNNDTWQYYLTTSQDDIDEMNIYVNGVGDTENPDPQPIAALDLDPGGLIIGQDQDALGGGFSTAENFEGILDELRFASVVRTAGWANAVYENMANQTTFIATSSSETLQATNFVELDHWVQYFDSTGEEADIWVQVEDLPAGEDTVIYLYYGNSGASSASDELATFSYSTSTDLYYVVDNSGVSQVTVESLIDGNEVSLDGAAAISLDQGESHTFGSVSNTSVFSTLGPISGTVTGAGNDSSDSIAPISFATTSFAIPHNRSANRTYILAPFASTTVRTYIGSSGTANQTFNITAGSGATATADPADSGTGTDGSGIVVEASSPVLVTHRSTNPGDGMVAYPPTMRDLFGVDSQYFHLSTLVSNPDPTVYCSTGSGGTQSGTTRGQKDDVTFCTTGAEGTGSAVRFANPATPISAVQFADSDGNETTVYWPQHEFGTRYAMTNDSAYAAIVCSPRFGSVDLEIQDASGNTIESSTCTPGATDPGKAYFGTDGDTAVYSGGYQVVSTNGVPFYVIYEDVSVEQDEKNILGPVQGRKNGGEFAGYTFGSQELANDAEWEQLSFWWYENIDSVTPTTAWQSGSESLSEGDTITGAGAVDNGDVLRLRLNLEASHATGSVNTNAFMLQYAAGDSGQCSAITSWYELGEQGSTTAAFSGYDNTNTADGRTLTTSLLASTTVLGTYEERNYSDFLPNEVPVTDVVEYDWVIEATNIEVNTNYCFRLTRAQGSELETYTTYPELETVGPPNTPLLYVFFDNERTGVLTPVLEFAATDNAGDDINYQVQIDDDYDFSSVTLDRNSDTHFTQFENINTPSDKAPFTSGARIRFTGASALSPTTTYYWRVRADDPNGSATTSDWSTPFSFTTDTTLTVSEWFQTTSEQFDTNTLSNLSTSSDQVAVTSSPGVMTSTAIDFDDGTVGNAWGEVDWNDTETSGTITYQVEYNSNGSWVPVPDSLIPGNSVGTSTGPISLLELDTDTYNEIRLVATFTGATLSLQDWVVRWGLRVDTPTQGDLFDNQKTPTTTPVFDFVSSDPQGDDLEYEISFSSSYDFSTGSTTYNSSTSPQFVNITDGGDSSPFDTGETVKFTTPGASPFTNGQTYWWRTRARDPNGGNAWSPWAEPDAFTVDTSITLSTWFQTTQDQFNQGTLTGTIASTSGSVEVSSDVGEYGTATLTDNNWLTINTQREYTDMVVVASGEFDGSAHGNSRTPRVRNKTSDSFEIKVDDYTDGFTGSTIVDYIVMEAGEWTIADGGSGARVIAGTQADVSDVQIDTYTNTPGVSISFSPAFSSAPVAIATVSSYNDSNWIATHIDGGGTDDTEVTTTGMRVALALSRHTTSAHSGPEDIDYIVMQPVNNGTNNSVQFESFNTNDQVDDVQTNGGYSQTFPTAFSSAPSVTVVHNNAEDGGNGGFALKDTSGTQNATSIFLSILEDGASADQHTQEIVSVIAFQNSSGLIDRHNTGSLNGTIAGENIIFSDGAGPKFDNFSWNDTTPATSDVLYQIEYEVSEGVYALVPDSQIPGNSTGTSTGPIDLTGVDINTYPIIRPLATLTCGGGSCPTVDDWQLEWSEGVNMSGTLKAYDRLTNVATGTIKAAVNGSPVVGSGAVSGGVWSMANVTAFAGDIVTVWVDGVAESEEAVAAFVYDGTGDITGVELFQQHLSISADENATTTNALLALNDSFALGDEDVFYQVDAFNNLVVCGVGTCSDANLYIGPGNIYIPDGAGGISVNAHDYVNDGYVELDSNTFNFTGSWVDNATTTINTATVNLAAATGTESITSTQSPTTFHNLSFGSGAGNATFDLSDDLDLSGSLTVASGTLARDGYDVNLAGSLTTGAGGFWSGTGTTTFDGAGSKTWTDNNATTQKIGNVIIDGASTQVSVTTDVAAYDITIGSNDLLIGGSGHTLYVGGDWNNTGTFNPETSTVEIINDDRTYPPVVPGSADWYADTDFEDRIPIIIQDSEVPGDLTDFPIYVDLAHLGTDFWNSVRSDGADIRITSGDGQTELPYELVEFDSTAHTGELHFLSDSVSSSATTTFYLYHNNPSASAYYTTDPYGRNAVWAEYQAVYHFTGDPTAISNSLTDATGNGYDLSVETEGLATSTGQLGTGVSLIGSTGLMRSSSFRWATGSPLSTSGWYKMTAASNEALWEFGTGAQPDQLYFEPWDNGTDRGQYIFGNTTGTTYNFNPRDTSNWNHFFTLGATSTSDSNYVYHDNILRETQAQTVADPGNTDANGLQVGRTGTGGSIEAEVDELRFAAVLRNTDWMTAEYNNQYTPEVFYATSSVETYVPDLIIDEATHNITAGGSAFNNLTLNDAITVPAFTEPSVVINNDFMVATGTITLPTGKLTIGGSFTNNGVFMHNNGEVEFVSSGAETIALSGTAFLNAFYNVTFDGSGTFTFTDTNATTSNDFVIDDGAVVFPSGKFVIGGRLTNNGGSFNANSGTVQFISGQNENVKTGGSSFNNVIFGESTNTSGWYDSAWGERVKIQIASTSVAAAMTDFPVYVNLASLGSTFWSTVLTDGGDIRVTTADGSTEIPVEVVEIDKNSKTGELHFLAPSLSGITDSTFYIYFDNSDATLPATDSTYGAEQVWVNYEAVYHFSEDPTYGVTDVSGHGKDLAPAVGTPSTTPGLLGTALDTTASNVMLSDADWTWTAGEDLISSGLYFQDNFDTGALWAWSDTCGGDNCLAFMPWYDNATRGYHRFGENSGNDYNFSRNNTIWHHFTTIGRSGDGESVEIYEDNVQRDSYTQSPTGVNPTQTGLQIGRYVTNTYMDIDVDELRFATTTPSVQWIETEYNNLTDVANFYSTSSQSYLEVVPSFTLDEAVTNAAGNVTIYYANLVAPTYNFNIGGSAQNTGGSYDPNSATTTFNSTDTGESFDFGNVSFYNLAFDGVGGGWTVSTTTVTNNLTLVNGASYVQATNTTMTVGGVFVNQLGAATNWTNSTLRLTGGDYTVTDRLDTGDDYATLVVSGDTDIVIWNSSISTSTVYDTSSLYMPDYNGSDGVLRIYGDYTRSSGAEYWSRDTDFDGTDLTGFERPVSVLIGRGANVYMATGTSLVVKGAVGATTTVSALSGIHGLAVNAGTLDVSYASFDDGGKDGLVLTNGTIVSSLTNSTFYVAGGRSGITVDATTINAQPSSGFTNVNFATSSANSIYEAAWTDQVIVTVQSAAVGEDLTDYPVYIDLSTLGTDFWAGVQSDGRDIRVTTDAGVELPVDLVEIDTTAQTGELHFLASMISASEDTAFYIHFNNPSATAYATTDQYGANAVWSGYESVYHFDEDPTVYITDMTGNNHDLFPIVGTAATTSGQLGTALDTTAGNVTLESVGWTWPAGVDLVSSGLYFQSAADTGALWEFGNTCVADTCIAFLPWYTGTTGYNRFGELTGSDYAFARNNTIWHHFTTIGRATDTAAVDIYEDNILRDTYAQTAAGENPTQTGLQIGRYTGGTYMDIDVDELRFTTNIPSAGWIDAEYTNFLTPTTFYATSSAQTFQYNVTADGVPTTFWQFSNGTGNLYGEAFDNDDGDPGSIQWDDSNFSITISGVVYSDDGVTPETYPVCNGSTELVTVVLDGTDTYTAPCDPLDGSFEITGITYVGEPKIVTYLDSGAATPQTNVAIYDETTGTGTVGSGVMTVTRPNVVDGSVLVLIAGKDDDPTITEPAGWTAIDTLGNTTGDQIDTGAWYRVVADASTEPTTYDFTADNGEGFSYWMGTLINVDTSTPLDVASTWTKLQNQYAPVASSITTVTNGSLVLSAWYVYRDTEVVPPIYGWSDRGKNIVGPETNSLTVSSLPMPTAGATGDATTTGVIATRDPHVAQFAFRPAATPTGSSSIIAAAVTKTPLGNSSPYDTVVLRDQTNAYGSAAAGANIVVKRPVVENGDVLITIIGKEDDFNITPPSGWTLGDERIEATGNDMYTAIWYHEVTNAGAEPDVYDFVNNDTSAEEYSYWIGSFSGVDATNVFDVTPAWSNLQNDSSPAAPAITTVTDGAYVLAAWYVIDDGAMDMPGSPWTTLAQDVVTNNRLLAVAGRSMPNYGNTGSAVMTGGSSDDVNVGQFALRPAAISVANEITDMDLYQDRVIVRHENAAALTIADMTLFDNDNESDLPFTASTSTSPDELQILPGSGLYVWAGKEFAPYGTVDLQGTGSTIADGSLTIGSGASYTSSSTHDITIGGSFYAESGATFDGASSPVTFTATTTGQQIGSAASSTITFYDLAFTGVGGGWAVQTPIVSETGIAVAAGTLSGVANITVDTGSFSGNGGVNLTGGTTLIKETNTLGGSGEWTFYNLTLGSGSVVGVTTRAANATTTVRNKLTIAAAHFLDAFGSVWDIQGSGGTFVENGTFLEGTSTVRYSGATPNILRTAYYNLNIDTESGGIVTATAPTIGLQVLGNFTLGALGTSTINIDTNDPVMAVAGNVYIGSLGTFGASNSSLLTVNGGWDNDGIFTSNGGTVQFSKTSGSATIAAGASSFGTVNILGSASYTISESATTTGNLTLNTTNFTLASGETLAVGGAFTNSMNDINTTWTNTTLRLYSGTAYTINTKTKSDTYNTIDVWANTHPRLWRSTTTVVNTTSNSSLYSMDHENVDGSLYIFGNFVNSSFDDHWSYATDFDGAALGASGRSVTVEVENGGGVQYVGGSLSVVGSSTASTSIMVQGAGTYDLIMGGNTDVVMNYYVVRDTTSSGLVFTGTPDISDLSYGDFEVQTADASAMTVGGSVIDVNPAQEYDAVKFATTTAINAYNVTATGTSASAWRFVNVPGNLGGEAKDVDPGGDPGYITWEDSAAVINISGTVYSDEGSTAMGVTVCDSVTNSIKLSVNGTTFASTTCAVGTGVYTFSNISYGLGNTLTVYIDNETEDAVTVTQDPISSISNFDLYQNRVIIKHESGAPMTIADMGVWDSDDDADILFDVETAGTDTLTLPADTKLIIWNNKQFSPGGDITVPGGGSGSAYDGTVELRDGATFTALAGETHTIGGSLVSGSGAVFNPGQSTTTFTSVVSGRTIDTNESGFYNLSIAGPGGWSVSDTNLSVDGDYTQSAGSITLPAATTTIGGSFDVSGGTFDANSGLLYFTATDAGNIVALNGSDLSDVEFAGVGGSWVFTDTNATATDSFTVSAGTVTLPSGTLVIQDSFVVTGAVSHNSGTVRLTDSGGGSLLTLGGSDLSNLEIAAGAGDYTLTDANAALLGDLIISSGSFTAGSENLSIAGSFDASAGTFVHNNGTLLFNSADTGESVDPGSNNLYNVVFASGSGGWTLANNATSTNNFTLSSASSFTMSSGTRLYVGGVFTNSVGGSATEWLGTRIVLDGANEYEVGGKTVSDEQYNILEIGANSDISTWNTAATATVIAASASWYSQDHAGSNGSLNIYGDYHIATTTEYWSYATDFDGTALGGSSRPVAVSIASSSTVSLDGGTLNIVGVSNSTTTITNQGSGAYTFTASAGTLTADYYSFRNIDSTGLQLTGTLSITSLDDGDFEQAANSTTLITLASTTLNNNASLTITDTRFDNGGFTSGTNVSLDATTTNSWYFTGSLGNIWGESYDVDGTDNCSSIRWDDSQCLLTEQAHYRWRNDDGGEGAPAGTWYDSNWSARKRVRVVNDDTSSYTDVAVKLDVTYDSDMQTDFDDLRFTDSSGTTTIEHWTERYSVGSDATVWVKIPSLTAQSVTEIYMYYGNVSATSTSDASNTFDAYDDFEDNDISEYSGDTVLFNTAGTFAYGGGYGLDTAGHESDKATDGIGRTDITVSQGQIIRFMQYVDTSAGSGDEVCTMFAVQSPVTDNNNYAVCIEQFGTDRISLVRDVVNTDSTGTLLDSANATLSTGWYEVEIDWQTDNTIDVELYTAAGTLVATTSATDSTYTSGGIGFTYWFQNGGWDSVVAWPRTETTPTSYFGGEQAEGGASWAASQDTATGGFLINETARLRIGIENTGLPIENQNFQLEFAPKLTAPSCEAISPASFTAVPVAASCTGSAVCMTTSASTTNGDPTTDHLVTDAGEFVAGEIIANTSNQTGNIDVDQDEYTELEYAIKLTSDATNDAYCFRVTDSGSALDSYAILPELTLAFDPILDTISLNNGVDITLTPGATTTVLATTTVTDYNGYSDLGAATTTFYKSTVTAACTPDNNNCYVATSTSCSYTNCATNSCLLTCSADFQFHADPTDEDGGEFWYAFVEVEDLSGGSDFGTSIGVDVLTVRALDVLSSINYGTLDINENTGSFNPTVSVVNLGNEAIDVDISGTDMTDGVASVIPAAEQLFATSTFTYDSCVDCTTLKPTGDNVEVDLAKPTVDSPLTSDDIYWGVEVPFGTASKPHTGVNTFTAISD